MFRKGRAVFVLTESEIDHILMCDNSDDESDLLLDEEDQKILTQDDDQGILAVEIEDGTSDLQESTSMSPQPSTSRAEPEAHADRNRQPSFKWSQRSYVPNTFRNVEYEFGKVQICQDVETALTPFDIFCSTTNFDSLVQNIVSESIKYAHQNGREFTIETEEMRAFLGMNLVMGYHILPSLRDYWSTEPDMGVPFISNVMPRVRFEDIRSNLHFCNNAEVRDTNSPNYDRAYKIRPVMEHLNSSFQNALNNTKEQSIDEHMIKFKGHNVMKQYIKNKPVKWGFKLWCRCDATTGYLFEFDLYTGKRTTRSEYGLGESVVLQLTKKLEGLGCEIYIDNFFNSPMLQYTLIDQNTMACGTVRSNRKHLPKTAPLDKNMKRGDIYTTSFHGITYVKWMDNKAVYLLTNFLSPVERVTVKRRKAGSADKIDVICPRIVSHYNKNMGGVDLMDQRKVCYEIDRRSKIKYYLRLFFDLLDISVNNAYTVYTKLHDQKHVEGSLLTNLQFRQVVARSLINGFTVRQRGIPTTKTSIVRKSVKRQLPFHPMQKSNNRKRCVQCAKNKKENRTNNTCIICEVHLCYTNERNCFAEYHN